MTDRPSWRGTPPVDDRLAQLQQAGQHFVLGLFSLLRTAAIHDLNNRALDRPVAHVLEGIAPFAKRAHGRFALVALEGQIYVDDIRVRLPGQSYHIVGDLEALFAEKGVGGVSFEGQPTPGQVRRFAHAFQHYKPPLEGEPMGALTRLLEQTEVGRIRVTRPVRASIEGEETVGTEVSSRVDTTITYAKAVSALSLLLADPEGRSQLRRRQINHVVREIADCASETLDYLIGLTEHSANRRDRARLCVDTCVVAISLARAMQLPRNLIADLGVAAMTTCQRQRANEGSTPEPVARAFVELIGAPRWSASLMRRALITAQRAQAVRGSGGLPDQYRLARIHRVARDYVSLTHGLSPDTLQERDELTPLEALSFLSQSPRSVYDPLVISQLVRIVGLYPVGSLVRLADGRQAYVVGRDEEGDPVLLIRTGPFTFGDRVPHKELGVAIVGVATEVDAGERAAAVLGNVEQQAVHDASAEVATGSTLARVRLQRMAVKRDAE